jgi:predicted S18 family serine protease
MMENTNKAAQEVVQETAQEEIVKAQESGVIDMGEKKEETKSLNYTHYFKKPVEIEGKQYKSLTFYFENLTGEDMEKIEAELQDQNKYVLTPEISSTFQCMMAARAAGVAADEIRRLPLRDYMKIKNKARDFLMAAGY